MILPNAKKTNLTLGLSIGEVQGIGPEIMLKALNSAQPFTTIIYGSPAPFSFYQQQLPSLTKMPWHTTQNLADLKQKAINLLQPPHNPPLVINPGKPNEISAQHALNSLNLALEHLVSKRIDALVTAPLQKNTLANIQPSFTGHTAYIAQRFPKNTPLMLMVHEPTSLRIATATEHIPLASVASHLTQPLLNQKLKTLIQSLKQDFHIQKPKIALLGLNPHAGEQGLLGREEQNLLHPVITSFQSTRAQPFECLIEGPFPADGFFGSRAYQAYDAVLCMYHDQGLVPFKLLSSFSGVNYTAGLPVVRTSPAHGTALSLAGKGQADATAMKQALHLAYRIVQRRHTKT